MGSYVVYKHCVRITLLFGKGKTKRVLHMNINKDGLCTLHYGYGGTKMNSADVWNSSGWCSRVWWYDMTQQIMI